MQLMLFSKHIYLLKNNDRNLFLPFQQSIDEVEKLIKRHEALEKALFAQEDRFSALEKLTTVSNQVHLTY